MAEGDGKWSSRKLGAQSSASRAALIDAAAQLMQEEGYAAVTSRRVAKKAGVGNQLVHYYFRTMDELYLAVFRRGIEQNLVRLRAAMESDQPLRAVWQFANDPRGTSFTIEFMALATHSEAIRGEIASYAEQFRQLQIEALSRHLKARGITPRISPTALSVVMTGISAVLRREAALGITLGHAETEALVEDTLRLFETTGLASLPQSSAS